ncbi:MAG: methyl-accepting chemotaxis protein [Acidobacteria bacterium]|nr:methyl-accepting chemotaxis protein [Acidobacteriota bacterium]
MTFLGLITHSVFVSHRIAGPLVRLRRALGAVGDGDLGVRVALRRKDYLGREQDVVNEMIDKLRASIGAAGSTTQDIRAGLVGLRTAIATGSRGDVLDQLTALDERADQLDAALGHFTCRSNGPVTEPLPRHDEAASRSTVGNRGPSPGLAIADPQ